MELEKSSTLRSIPSRPERAVRGAGRARKCVRDQALGPREARGHANRLKRWSRVPISEGMKIQQLGSFQAGNFAPVGQTAKTLLSAKPAATDGGATTAPPLQGEQMRQRIEAFEGRISRRFEAMLSRSDLTPEQRAGLEDAQKKLHGMLGRLDHALDDGQATGAMENIMSHLRDTVSAVFQPTQSDSPSRPTRSGNNSANNIPVTVQSGDDHTRRIDTLA